MVLWLAKSKLVRVDDTTGIYRAYCITVEIHEKFYSLPASRSVISLVACLGQYNDFNPPCPVNSPAGASANLFISAETDA